MSEESSESRSEWLAMSNEEFEEIRGKAELILRTIPTLIDKAEASARAMLELDETRAIETLSRKRIAEHLRDCAKGRLEQASTTRALLAMLDSTWRCLAEVRRSQRASGPGGPPEGQEEGG